MINTRRKSAGPARVCTFTLAAMCAFAANSLLCRLALKQLAIDAASFTAIRIGSGTLMLWLIVKFGRHPKGLTGSWISALTLFAYAAGFSFAYVTLSAGTGALLLFAAVQATMIVWGFRQGERLHIRQSVGLVLAGAGLVLLLFPGLSAPPIIGAALMLAAGFAWGIYSLRGSRVSDPIGATAGNFLRAAPFAIVLIIVGLRWAHADRAGVACAIASGAITSGLGYVAWYAALPGLKAASAATVQLSVPVLTAMGGILFLHESITLRLLIAAMAVLGGIALVVVEKPSVPSG